MPFNLSFIKEMKKKYDELANLFNKTNKELEQTKEEFQQTKETERKIEEIKEESDRIKSDDKEYAKSIVAAGYDEYNQLGVNPNNRDRGGNYTAIHPPQKLPVEPSSLLFDSSYCYHTILITKSFSLQGVGDNSDGRMSSSLPKTDIKQFSEISMRDRDGQRLIPVSAVCGNFYTLFMFSKKRGNGNQLVFCDSNINGGSPVFLDIGNKQPLSLFGGIFHSAAISTDGEVIFINRDSVRNSPSARIESSSLPNGEKATSVACCGNRVIALSSSCVAFSSEVDFYKQRSEIFKS